jgi:prolyl-tRNA editing enzyme YbaK/EbsC (Cys-tRNA(Pro) deacylase)
MESTAGSDSSNGIYTLGSLTSDPVAAHPELVSATVLEALRSLALDDAVGVVEIDPELSDTAATEEAYGLSASTLANCVIVTGRREGEERTAACLVASTTRADINGIVKRRLDVRKASFMSREVAVETTGMEFGGITPIGLPAGWPVLVDDRIVETPFVIIGSGVRRSKLLVPGKLFASMPGFEIIDGLGREIPAA